MSHENDILDLIVDSTKRHVAICNGGEGEKYLQDNPDWSTLFKSPFKIIKATRQQYWDSYMKGTIIPGWND